MRTSCVPLHGQFIGAAQAMNQLRDSSFALRGSEATRALLSLRWHDGPVGWRANMTTGDGAISAASCDDAEMAHHCAPHDTGRSARRAGRGIACPGSLADTETGRLTAGARFLLGRSTALFREVESFFCPV